MTGLASIGFGRIGRLVLRAALGREDIEVRTSESFFCPKDAFSNAMQNKGLIHRLEPDLWYRLWPSMIHLSPKIILRKALQLCCAQIFTSQDRASQIQEVMSTAMPKVDNNRLLNTHVHGPKPETLQAI